MAHHVAGLVVHFDNFGHVADFADPGQPPLVNKRPKFVGGAENKEPNIGVLLRSLRNARDDSLRALIAAHGVDGNCNNSGSRQRICGWFRHSPGAVRSLRCVFVQVDLVGLSNDFAIGIVTAGTTNVVRALQLATVRAFRRVRSRQGIMRAAHVAAGRCDFILRDSHVRILDLVSKGGAPVS